MNKNQKELRILVVLLAAFLIYGFYVLLLSPKITENRELSARVSSEDLAIRSKYATSESFPAKRALLEEHRGTAHTLARRFFVEETQEAYFDRVNALLSESGMKFTEISTEDTPLFYADEGTFMRKSPFETFLGPSSYASGHMDVAQLMYELKQVEAVPELGAMELTVEMTGKKSGFQKVLRMLENESRYVICREMTVDILSDTSDPEVRAKLSLTFLNLRELLSANGETGLPETLPAFTMPEEFLIGKYRSLYDIGNISAAFKSLF